MGEKVLSNLFVKFNGNEEIFILSLQDKEATFNIFWDVKKEIHRKRPMLWLKFCILQTNSEQKPVTP
jgi:hypothetical protein